jgi:transcriptional regulator with XRE-family HTH domain
MIKVKAKTALQPSDLEAPFSEGMVRTPEFDQAWVESQERRMVGRLLERMRRDANETQASLAAKMGKDQAFISRMESGRGPMPKAQHIALWARHCGYMTAYAFVAKDEGDDHDSLRLHELMPIAQGESETVTLQAVHDVALSIAAKANIGKQQD